MTSKGLKWTARGIEALTVIGRRDFTDPQSKGLTLRVTHNGSKSWALLYRRASDGRKRRTTIGPYPEIGLAEARAQAAELKVAIQKGRDPAGEVAAYKRADTVDQLFDQFLDNHPRPDAAWTKEVKRIFAKDARPLIGSIKLPDLRRAHVRTVLEAVKKRGTTVAVNRTLAAIRRAFSWGVSKDILEVNPALNLPTDIEERHRERSLSIDEIRLFWAGLEAAGMAPRTKLALRLLLVTAQRPGEVCGMRRDEVDLEAGPWLIPGNRTKNRRPHLVPLSPLAIRLLQEALEIEKGKLFVFSSRPRARAGRSVEKPLEAHGLSHAMRLELKALGLESNPARPHDLRRTAATHMARLGISDRIVGRILNHGTELRRTITSQVYIHHDYAAEKQNALEAWANELGAIVSGKRSKDKNVVLLNRGSR
jgi:integrase